MASALGRPPWTRIGAGERVDHLPELLAVMFDVVLRHPPDAGDEERMRGLACAHGAHREAAGFDVASLLEEHYILRDQVYRHLCGQLAHGELHDLMARFDHALSIVTLASLRCMHGLAPSEA